MTDKLKGSLGLCRKANKMAIGHDAVVASIKARKAYLSIACQDASERVKREIADECSFDNRKIPFVEADFAMQELSLCIGKRAGVISIEDRGFAEKLQSILEN